MDVLIRTLIKIFRISSELKSKLLEIALVALIGSLSILLFIVVLGRYLFKFAIGPQEEAARFGFIWLTFLGAALCSERKQHMRLDSIIKLFNLENSKILKTITEIVILAVASVMIVKGFKITLQTRSEYYVMLGISMSWAFVSIPISGILIFINSLLELTKILKSLRDRDEKFVGKGSSNACTRI